MRRRSALYLVALFLLFGLEGIGASTIEKRSWVVRAGGYTSNPPYEPFALDIVGSDRGRLFGIATYSDYRRERLPVLINGVSSAKGQFWPEVSAQVAKDLNGPWQNVRYRLPAGQKAVLEVTLTSTRTMLFIDLSGFRRFVDQKRFGKVLLKNGETATFMLEQLLGPAGPSEKMSAESPLGWDRELPSGPPDGIIVKPPFTMLRISSDPEGIQGACGYIGTTSTEIEGTESNDGAFWPNAVAQVANDVQGVWLILGKVSGEGKPTTFRIPPNDSDKILHVRLDLFRPMVGKYRYGRVVLENAASAVFELKDILPP